VLGDPENRAVHARSPSLATTGRQRRCRGRSGLIGKPGSRQQIDTPYAVTRIEALWPIEARGRVE
jgi:hypothetical protein